MIHSTLPEMLDELMANPDELFISSNSKHCALYSTREGGFLFLEGDFSGTEAQQEAEVHRIVNDLNFQKEAA